MSTLSRRKLKQKEIGEGDRIACREEEECAVVLLIECRQKEKLFVMCCMCTPIYI